ncbi:hypothetical protein ACFRAR_15905 [Kitasatospora sp. NPDC056651]|uniref:hypothetical protein n=1 Tax=Kitasatospora sp. NPDC056651 TaxID=3345892 RepID=UPI003691AB67
MTGTVTVHPATRLTGPGDQPLRLRLAGLGSCPALRLEWPAAPAPRLLPGPDTHTPTPGWTLAPLDTGGVELRRAAPGSEGSDDVAGIDVTEIDVTGLDAAAETGRLPLTVTALDADGRPAHTSRHILFIDRNPAIKDFKATDLQVSRDPATGTGTTTLTWTGRTGGGSYHLSANGSAPTPVTDRPTADGVYTHTVTGLTEDTAFGLRWEGENPSADSAAAMVLVKDGDIKAGKLSADGIVALLGAPRDYTCDDFTSDGDARSAQATTDGILLVSLDAGNATATSVSTNVRIRPSQGNPYDRTLTCPTTADRTYQAHTQLPVPAGATVTLVGTTPKADLRMSWIPFGKGALKGAPQPVPQPAPQPASDHP